VIGVEHAFAHQAIGKFLPDRRKYSTDHTCASMRKLEIRRIRAAQYGSWANLAHPCPSLLPTGGGIESHHLALPNWFALFGVRSGTKLTFNAQG
jgi:hypothetical protein